MMIAWGLRPPEKNHPSCFRAPKVISVGKNNKPHASDISARMFQSQRKLFYFTADKLLLDRLFQVVVAKLCRLVSQARQTQIQFQRQLTLVGECFWKSSLKAQGEWIAIRTILRPLDAFLGLIRTWWIYDENLKICFIVFVEFFLWLENWVLLAWRISTLLGIVGVAESLPRWAVTYAKN